METSRSSASLSKRGQLVQEWFRTFQISLKNLALYRHSSEGLERFLQPPHEILTQYHQDYGHLHLTVKPFAFLVEDEQVFFDNGRENNIPYRFYRDGFRRLTLEKGMTLETLQEFIVALLPTTQGEEDDLKVRFWQLGLDKFSYLVIEGFEENNDPVIEKDFEEIVDFLKMRLEQAEHQKVQFRGFLKEDQEMGQNLSSAQAQRELSIGALPCTAEEKEVIQAVLEAEEEHFFPKAGELLLILSTQYNSPEDVERFEALVMPVVERLIERKKLHLLTFFVGDLLEITRQIHPSFEENYTPLKEKLLEKITSQEVLSFVIERLKSEKEFKEFEIVDISNYLILIGKHIVKLLLDELLTFSVTGRRLVLKVLFELVEKEKILSQLMRMSQEEPSLMLDILVEGHKKKGFLEAKHLKTFLQSPNPSVKKEALFILGNQYPDELFDAAKGFLEDVSDAVMQRAAVEVLCRSGSEGVQALTRYVESKNFQKLEREKQNLIYRYLGQTLEPSVLKIFEELLMQKSSLFRPKVDKQKEQAIVGLIAFEHPDAMSVIVKALKEGHHSKEIRQALERAFHSLKMNPKLQRYRRGR